MHPFNFVINVVMNVNVFLQATTGNVSLHSPAPFDLVTVFVPSVGLADMDLVWLVWQFWMRIIEANNLELRRVDTRICELLRIDQVAVFVDVVWVVGRFTAPS